MLTGLVGSAGLQNERGNFEHESQMAADLCTRPALWGYPTAFMYSHTLQTQMVNSWSLWLASSRVVSCGRGGGGGSGFGSDGFIELAKEQ